MGKMHFQVASNMERRGEEGAFHYHGPLLTLVNEEEQ